MGVTTTGLSCSACGTQLPQDSLFCNKCGKAVSPVTRSAEYKQVTVLFADVVHSMDIAKAVGAERLREIMAGLLDQATAVVARYGGTVDKFTGDGVMAVFGAPVALEDHGVRACRAALDIHAAIRDLAEQVKQRDRVQLRLRIGLNSGEVIAGDIGSNGAGYTAIGEQVGMAQRMESVSPNGGVMLSASTSRLVGTVASLGDPELVHIKGSEQPVVARRLLGVSEPDRESAGTVSALVGRRWEMAAVEGLFQGAIEGRGAVVTVAGSPGIGKSRLVREVTAMAAASDVDSYVAFCESHASDIPFYVVARLLRAAFGLDNLNVEAARTQLRARVPDADPEDLLLFDDLLGIADPEVKLPKIDPDARRRRLTALVNAASLARSSPAVYIVEDVHWIDKVSESLLADFVAVIPQTRSMVLITYRPEYSGVLDRLPGSQCIALAPLTDSETKALVSELLGGESSIDALGQKIVERAAGNPFFAQEMVRDLAERGVLQGVRGAYSSAAGVAEVSMPATVQATIAARIDRLAPDAKRTLSAAAVIGSRFNPGLLETLGIEPRVGDLVLAELVDQVRFTGAPEYQFHHPLIRSVAYEAQLKSDRAELHRRVAAAIEARDPAAVEEAAALIAEHLEAAGDLPACYSWHLRAGAWATSRNMAAARGSWERARTIADSLPSEDPNQVAMRIAPRTMLCGTAYRVHPNDASARFDELRQLCAVTGDKAPLAVAMAGLVMDHAYRGRMRQASKLASEAMTLIESLGDPTLIVGLSFPALYAKIECGQWADVLRWSERVVHLAEGDPFMGNFIFGSPLALALESRGTARYSLGLPGWREDLRHGLEMAHGADPLTYAGVAALGYFPGVSNGVLAADDRAVREIKDALRLAERAGNDMAPEFARMALGVALAHRHTVTERDQGLTVMAQVSDVFAERVHNLGDRPLVDVYLAREWAWRGDTDEAIPLVRSSTERLVREGQLLAWGIPATAVLVQTLIDRGGESDVAEATAAIIRLAKAPAEDRLFVRDIWLLRLHALLARVEGDDVTYRDYRDRYRKMANELGFEGHMQWAEEMP